MHRLFFVLFALLLPAHAFADSADTFCAEVEAAAQPPIHLAEDDFLAFLCRMRKLPPEKLDDAIEAYRKKSPEPLWVMRREVEREKLTQILTREPVADPIQLIVPPKLRGRFLSGRGEKPYLGPGPLIRPRPRPDSREGHYGVTYRALHIIKRAIVATSPLYDKKRLVEPAMFASEMHEVLADAAQDADFYAWEIAAAHAQTPCNESGNGAAIACAAGQPKCHQDAFVAWMRKQMTRASAACKAPDKERELVYWIGYSLHGIQDLAAHKGRTNAEHSYNSYSEKHCNPDDMPENSDLAEDLSARFLVVVANGLRQRPDCMAALSRITTQLKTPSSIWKTGLHGNGWTILQYLGQYRWLAGKYKTLGEKPVRWFDANTTCDKPAKPLVRCEDSAECEALFNSVAEATLAAFAGSTP